MALLKGPPSLVAVKRWVRQHDQCNGDARQNASEQRAETVHLSAAPVSPRLPNSSGALCEAHLAPEVKAWLPKRRPTRVYSYRQTAHRRPGMVVSGWALAPAPPLVSFRRSDDWAASL